MRIQIKVDDKKFRKELNKLSSKIKNPTPALYEIGEGLLRELDARWGKDPSGRNWQALKRAALAQKRAENKSTKILERNVILKNSFNYRLVGKASLLFGTPIEYAAIHQFGGKTAPHTIMPYRKKALYWIGAAKPVKKVRHPGSNIPARPMIGIEKPQQEMIVEILESYVNK